MLCSVPPCFRLFPVLSLWQGDHVPVAIAILRLYSDQLKDEHFLIEALTLFFSTI